jgi:serine O-acetyltransferase
MSVSMDRDAAGAQSDATKDVGSEGVWSLLRQDVHCVFERDPAARNLLEVLTTYPGVHAIVLYRLASPLWRRRWRFVARLLSYIARIWTGIDIHPGARIGRRFFIDHGSGVVIGETATVWWSGPAPRYSDRFGSVTTSRSVPIPW